MTSAAGSTPPKTPSPPDETPLSKVESRVEELAGNQAKEAEKNREYKRQQMRYNLWLAGFTGLLFLTSVVANLVGILQLRQTERTVEMSMRPYISVFKAEWSRELRVGELPQAEFTIANFGRTPVWIKEGHGLFQDATWLPASGFAPTELPVAWEKEEELLGPVGVAPGQERKVVVIGKSPLTESLRAQIMQAQRTFYIQGEFTIVSPAFEAEERVEYCFYYDPVIGKRFGACRNSNRD